MDDFILSQDDEFRIKNVRQQLTDFLTDVIFLHGLSRGYAVGVRDDKNKGFILSHLLAPCFDQMYGLWYFYWGNLYFGIRKNKGLRDDNSIFEDGFCYGNKLDLRVFPSYDPTDFDGTRLSALIASMVENQVTKQLKGIRLENRFTYCQAEPSKNQYLAICHFVADRWLCDKCIDKFSLAEPPPSGKSEPNAKLKERAKLTPSLRYQILLRDNFTCRSCGRSPAKGDDVKLHVDHIFPIARGGKTEPENLCVLCQDCNIGKSDNVTTSQLRD